MKNIFYIYTATDGAHKFLCLAKKKVKSGRNAEPNIDIDEELHFYNTIEQGKHCLKARLRRPDCSGDKKARTRTRHLDFVANLSGDEVEIRKKWRKVIEVGYAINRLKTTFSNASNGNNQGNCKDGVRVALSVLKCKLDPDANKPDKQAAYRDLQSRVEPILRPIPRDQLNAPLYALRWQFDALKLLLERS